jgi:hypothetical protein
MDILCLRAREPSVFTCLCIFIKIDFQPQVRVEKKHLLRAQGKFGDAEPLYLEALDGRRRTLGDSHPSTLFSINNLALLLQEQGKLVEAEPLAREALDGFRRTLGDSHPSTRAASAAVFSLLAAKRRNK